MSLRPNPKGEYYSLVVRRQAVTGDTSDYRPSCSCFTQARSHPGLLRTSAIGSCYCEWEAAFLSLAALVGGQPNVDRQHRPLRHAPRWISFPSELSRLKRIVTSPRVPYSPRSCDHRTGSDRTPSRQTVWLLTLGPWRSRFRRESCPISGPASVTPKRELRLRNWDLGLKRGPGGHRTAGGGCHY